MVYLQVDFKISYRNQDISLLHKIIEKFKKRNPNINIGQGGWFIKEIIKKYLQHRRDYINKDNNKEIAKVKAAIKKSAAAVVAAENNESEAEAAEEALIEAENIVAELEARRQPSPLLSPSPLQTKTLSPSLKKTLPSSLQRKVLPSPSKKILKERIGK